MKKYRYLLFDLDGTLTYSHPGIYASIRYALEDAGRGEPTERQLRSCVGPPLVYSFRHIFGMTEEETNRAVVKYRERYSEKGLFENSPVPGARETLQRLKAAGYVSALATSKPKIFAEKIADKFGFTPFLETVAGSGTDGSFPTKGSVIREAMRLLRAEKELCLMLGDRRQNAEGARECDIDFAGFSGGYAEPGELEAEAPAFLFSDFEELRARLCL